MIFQTLSVRAGDRPATNKAMPHSQMDQHPDRKIFDDLVDRAFSLPGVERRPSRVSVPGAQALWVDPSRTEAWPMASFLGGEFAHIHPYPDGSLHVTLPPERGEEAIEKGWAEPHPMAGFMAGASMVMLYAPRDDEELETVLALVKDAYDFATDGWDEVRSTGE